jgi:hypothetical protein
LYLDPMALRDLVNMAKYKKGLIKEKPVVNLKYQYIETQIHGNIEITRDIAHVMLSNVHVTQHIVNRLNRDKIPFTIIGEKRNEIIDVMEPNIVQKI